MGFSNARVGDHFEFRKGLGYLGKYLKESRVALIGLNAFEGGGGYKFGGEKTYSGPYKSDHVAHTGDLFISTTDITQDGRVLGSPCILPDLSDRFEEVIFSGDIVKAIARGQAFSAEFLYNVMCDPKNRLKVAYASTGSTVRRVPVEVLENLEVPIPPFREQIAINRALALFDAKIRLNSEMANTLEKIAQIIFKSWFIDFDPIHAKSRGEQPEGIDAETAVLFPDSFQDSELGEIPEGWSSKKLTEVGNYLNGIALQKYPAIEGQEWLPVIKIPQVKSGTVAGAGRANNEVPEKYIVKDGDILFSWSGALEVTLWAGGKGALNQHLFRVTPVDCPQWFVYFATLSHLETFRDIAASKATTMGHIQRGHLDDALIALPPLPFLEKASKTIEPLLSLAVEKLVEARTLVEIRDALLPRLISGELEIPDELLGE